MSKARWNPAVTVTTKETFLLKRLKRTKKLFGFLRQIRHELFNEEFQAELEGMYRGTGAGKASVPPALMAMAVLLQAYTGASDAEAVELTVVDMRWQLVLDRLGADKPALNARSNLLGREVASIRRSCRRICAWQWTRCHWKAPVASKTL